MPPLTTENVFEAGNSLLLMSKWMMWRLREGQQKRCISATLRAHHGCLPASSTQPDRAHPKVQALFILRCTLRRMPHSSSGSCSPVQVVQPPADVQRQAAAAALRGYAAESTANQDPSSTQSICVSKPPRRSQHAGAHRNTPPQGQAPTKSSPQHPLLPSSGMRCPGGRRVRYAGRRPPCTRIPALWCRAAGTHPGTASRGGERSGG